MKYARNIFLVGPMGTGKTTIGKYLAKSMGLVFADLDIEVEARCGANIAWIFDIEGEAGFRNRESQLLDELSQRQDLVLATGGGAVLNPQNREWLKARGLVVYLDSDIEQLLDRTRRDRKRPLLQVDNPRAVLEKLLEDRDPLYREVADIVVSSTRSHRPQQAAEELAEQLKPVFGGAA